MSILSKGEERINRNPIPLFENQGRNEMNISHQYKNISISQIVNRNLARYRIHFNSPEEFNSPNIWKQIMLKRAAFSHFDAVVIDHTPEEEIDGLKKYSILYGLKYLFAAEMLNIDLIPVRVLNNAEELDSAIVTEFFNVDYLSLPSYEKGRFIENLRKKWNLTYSQLATKSGFTYSSLQNMGAAYNVSKRFPSLEDPYKQGKINVSVILHSKSIFESTSVTIHQKLTDFIVDNGKYADELLRETLSNNSNGILATEAVMSVISSERSSEPVRKKIVDQISKSLQEDGADLSREKQQTIAEKMKTDKKHCIQMLSYQTIRENCFDAYQKLCAILPSNLILNFDIALTLPDRTEFSYAVPAELKKLCRNKTPRDVNGKRLFSRIMEYVVRAGSDLSKDDILNLTSEFYEDYYNQRQFSKFFKFSILYRNFRNKVISEINK